jgi:CubicO group peptidase (beta-lactamase class C family)
MSIQTTRRVAATVLATLAVVGATTVPPALGVTAPSVPIGHSQRCNDPTGQDDFEPLSPAPANLDAVALQELLDWAGSRNSASVRVYRHGCLVGTSRMDAITQDLPNQWASTSKAVNALVVGRAVQLGLVSLSDPVSKWFPEADAAHGKILLRHLITQTGGLRVSLGDTWNNSLSDGVRIALHQEVVHEPGTYFSYQQHGLTLLLACVQRAAGGDVQDFMQQELFGKLGIERDQWWWVRDRAGWTEGWYGLNMSPRLMPRLAHLMLNGGVWHGERLLPEEFVRAARSSTPTNGGYGYLMWTNQGDSYWTTELPARRLVRRPLIPSAPRDTYAFAGTGGQLLYVIPSLDMVIERSGGHPARDPAPDLSRGGGGDFEWELFRMLNRAVTDADWGDPGPFQPLEPAADPAALVNPEQIVAGVGVGARAGGCNPAGCDGKVDISGYQEMGGEATTYAVQVTRHGVG